MYPNAKLIVATFATFLFLGEASRATPVPIVNPGFESDVLSEGSILNSITGWVTSVGGGNGVFNTTATHYPAGAHEGQNVAYINFLGSVPSQILSTALEPDAVYTLRVEVGRRLDESFAGYVVQLRAGGVVLAEDDDSLAPAPGQFVTSTVTYVSTYSDPQLGEPLEIRLLAKGVQVNYDDVRLDVARGPNGVCPEGSQVVDLRTGQDDDADDLDDNWTFMDPGAASSDPAELFHPPFAAWRGAVQTLGPFNTGLRYPVLGDGRWITNDLTVGDAVYELKFTLDGSCPWPVLALEVNFDNHLELALNGTMIFANTSDPPAPWLSNELGIYHPDASSADGLLHPSCAPPAYRCSNTEDNHREIHPVIVDGPEYLNLDGENTLTATVHDEGLITGFLVTGGADTSILSGATVRCCVPERPKAAAVLIFSDGFESGDTFAW